MLDIYVKFHNLRNYFCFVLILCKIGGALSQTSQKNSSQLYNVVQQVQGFVDNIQATQEFENFNSGFASNDALKNTQQINFDVLPVSLLNAFKNAANSSCLQDLQYMAQSINLKDPRNNWALKMLDSYGKPESGILLLNTKWLGDFNECRNVYAPKQNASGGFHGKYCIAQVSLLSFPLTIGLCLPETCDPLEFTNLNLILNAKSMPTTSAGNIGSVLQSVSCKANTRHLSKAAIATICLISIFLSLVVVGSSITVIKYFTEIKNNRDPLYENDVKLKVTRVNNDIGQRDRGDSEDIRVITDGSRTSVFQEKSEQFFNCFCVFTNGSKLLDTDSTEGQLLCLHGIRFLSMSWVILCHVYMGSNVMLKNIGDVVNQIDNLPFQVVLNGFFSVDSFFVLSGFLMAFLYFQEAAKGKGNISWVYFYVHRYLRLTPVYMMVLAFYTTVSPYLGSGPFFTDVDIDPTCQKHWWWNLLYISNFLNTPNQCMGWSWYLANDMQFFVISPLFLITLWRWPKIGYSILALFFCGTWIASFVITYHYNLVAGLSDIASIASDPTFMQRFNKYYDKVYIKPYTRFGPYLVGIVLAYIFLKRKLNNHKINFVTLCIGWTLSTAIGLTCVYSLHHNKMSRVAASFYNSLSRTCYGVCLSWVIYICLSGRGGVVDKILSYKLFIPLSRLTYCAYLIHPIVVTAYFASLKHTLLFTHSTMVTLFLGLILITYALAFLVSLVFESPLIRLEKFVRSKFQS